MKVINISKRKFDNLEPLKLPQNVTNTEGTIYNFSYQNKEKILKSLHALDGETFANKLYTLEMLSAFEEYLPKSFYIPDFLVSVNGNIAGFTIPKVSNSVTLTVVLHDRKITHEEKLYYLKSVGSVLDQLKNIRKYTNLKNIYINDLHDSNFMVNIKNKELAVIDLDSCKIASNSAFSSRFMATSPLVTELPNKYIINAQDDVIANEETDLYCYTIMILNYLYKGNVHLFSNEEFFEYLNYLESLKINRELIEIFSKIVLSGHNINPLHYIDSLTEEQIRKSSSSVYNLVRKK